LITNKYYIGIHSTNNLNDGYKGSGRNLWYSLKKYGKENHKLEILEYYDDRKSLTKRERDLVNEKTIKDEMCMNICLGGGGGNSEITKAAMWRPDVRERYLAGIKDRVFTEEHIKNVKKANTGRKKTPEENKKRSTSLLLYYQHNEVPEETRKILSEKSKELWANRTDREEVSKKISDATKEAMWRPDVRERYLNGIKNRVNHSGENHWGYGKSRPEETKMKIRESNKGKVRSVEFKQNVSAGMKKFRLEQRKKSPETKLYLAKNKNTYTQKV